MRQWRVEKRGDYYYVSLYEDGKRVSGQNLAFVYRYEAVEYANKLNKANKHSLTNPMEDGEWTPIHAIRFNSDGSVSLMGSHINPAKLGTGARFKALTGKLAGREGVYSPKGLAAYIGIKKYGKKKMMALAARGRKRKHRR
jgi:hypothetical protein